MWDEAEAFLEKDKYLGLLVKKYRPCMIKPIPSKDYFEDLVASIVGQQLSSKAAKTIFGRLKEKAVKITPENILKLEKTALRECGLSNAKSDYVRNLAEHVVDGKLHLNTFKSHLDEDVRSELVAVKGIGNWTADMFLMFALARPDIFPIEDLGIGKGLKLVTGKTLTKPEMLGFSARWQPYRTVASWYLWRAVDS